MRFIHPVSIYLRIYVLKKLMVRYECGADEGGCLGRRKWGGYRCRLLGFAERKKGAIFSE